ncbi:hypothetical protein L195_g043595 [Trifolium pratense]|uniref:Retrotransposon gag domain-containing protein n=1 Tax=Trifolium pratense TaxID=57577 RepID=A0A2K3M9P2_TRIPR|nr:hypothetical protein L195_g043595 [Trifolium pratense]
MEENNLPLPPRRTMGDYCRRKQSISRFRPTNLVNFDIKSNVLAGHAKNWLQCLPSGTIQAWNELEDKFLERFFTHNRARREGLIFLTSNNMKQNLCARLMKGSSYSRGIVQTTTSMPNANIYWWHEDATQGASRCLSRRIYIKMKTNE